jgi:hypothetical protein
MVSTYKSLLFRANVCEEWKKERNIPFFLGRGGLIAVSKNSSLYVSAIIGRLQMT